MGEFLLTYDIRSTHPDAHSIFIEMAGKCGWSKWILTVDDLESELPNTTLYGIFNDLADADSALEKALSLTAKKIRQPVKIEKWVICPIGTALLVTDKTRNPSD
ncbi:hypothetical protein [Xanthobacter flavus]|uniref:hypothetical protein n=1 Tax=Xanthobacter flavus TaxID=281 RepID=UPI00372ADD8D